MFFSENKVKTAVSRSGGPTKASNLMGVSNAAVHAWMRAGRVSNIVFAKKLAELAGLQLVDVRYTR